jgi:hypothetical protein
VADAVRALAKLFRATPVPAWRAYLTFHYLIRQADIMPAAFDEANFELYGKTLSGSPQPRDRWKLAVGEINGAYGAGPLGDAVGRLYVQEHFPPESKAAIRAMVNNLLGRLPGAHQGPGVDVSRDAGGRHPQGPDRAHQDRLPRSLEGLHGPHHRAGRRIW